MSWPGRLQDVTDHFDLPSTWTIIYDGGHNPAAGVSLADYIRTGNRDTHIIVGMMHGKDVTGFLRPLTSVSQSVTAITIPSEPHAMSAHHIADSVLGVNTALSIAEALQKIVAYNKGGEILICGSLYLAAHL